MENRSNTPPPNQTVLPVIRDSINELATFISLGPVIYLLGVPKEPGRFTSGDGDAFSYATTAATTNVSTPKWTEGSHMLSARVGPVAIALDGKIYAFGGFHSPDDQICEVFNPKLNEWSAEPPSLSSKGHVVVTSNVFRGKKQILLTYFGSNSLFAYTLGDTNPSWRVICRHFQGCYTSLVVVDDTLFGIHDNGNLNLEVKAYDLRQKAFLPVSPKFAWQDLYLSYPARLFHLGDGKLRLMSFRVLHFKIIAECVTFRTRRRRRRSRRGGGDDCATASLTLKIESRTKFVGHESLVTQFSVI